VGCGKSQQLQTVHDLRERRKKETFILALDQWKGRKKNESND